MFLFFSFFLLPICCTLTAEEIKNKLLIAVRNFLSQNFLDEKNFMIFTKGLELLPGMLESRDDQEIIDYLMLQMKMCFHFFVNYTEPLETDTLSDEAVTELRNIIRGSYFLNDLKRELLVGKREVSFYEEKVKFDGFQMLRELLTAFNFKDEAFTRAMEHFNADIIKNSIILFSDIPRKNIVEVLIKGNVGYLTDKNCHKRDEGCQIL